MHPSNQSEPLRNNNVQHVWIVQGAAKPEILAIRDYLYSLWDFPLETFSGDRINFWFEEPYKALKKYEQETGQQIPIFIPVAPPKDSKEGKLNVDLIYIGRKLGIHFVPVPADVLEAAKRFDNYYIKPYAHGANDLASEYSPKDFVHFKKLNEILADAVAAEVTRRGWAQKNLAINVQNKYFWPMSHYFRENGSTCNSTIQYFSHIPLIATHAPLSFDTVHPEVRDFYAHSFSCYDAVSNHSPDQASKLGEFTTRTNPNIAFNPETMTLEKDGHTTQLGNIFLSISANKWKDIVRGETAWKVAAEVLEAMDGRQSATMYGRLDVFKGLDKMPLIVEQLFKDHPEMADHFVFTNVYGRVNLTSDNADEELDPFAKKEMHIQETMDEVGERLSSMDAFKGKKLPFLKFERINEKTGAKKEFLSQEELGGLIIATMLTQGVFPVPSTEEGFHMGVFECLTGAAYYLFDNPRWFKENCIKHLGMNPNDPRIANASVVPIVSKYSGAAHYLGKVAGGATFIMDPFDIKQSADELYKSLTLSREERLKMHKKAYDYICNHTPADWVTAQLNQGEAIVRTKRASRPAQGYDEASPQQRYVCGG